MQVLFPVPSPVAMDLHQYHVGYSLLLSLTPQLLFHKGNMGKSPIEFHDPITVSFPLLLHLCTMRQITSGLSQSFSVRAWLGLW